MPATISYAYHSETKSINSKSYTLGISDIGGLKPEQTLSDRHYCYSDNELFVLCFSYGDKESLNKLDEWKDEIDKYLLTRPKKDQKKAVFFLLGL